MPRNQITKDEIGCWILKCKNKLHNEDNEKYKNNPKDLTNKYLDMVLDKLGEYRY